MPTSLGTFYGLTSTSASIEEPQPTFFLHGQYGQSQYPVQAYDSKGSLLYSGYYVTNTEMWNNYSPIYSGLYPAGGYGYLSTGSNGSWNWGQSCTNNQAEGSYIYNYPSSSLAYGSVFKAQTHTYGTWPYFGVVIGTTGKRQRISIYSSSSALYIFRRGAYPIDVFTLSATYMNTTGEPGSTTYGMVCYNERTKTLALLRTGGSNTYRLHVWKHPSVNLNNENYLAGDLKKFLLEAKNGTGGASYFYNDFTLTDSGSTSYQESAYHMRLVISDNGKIGMARMVPSNGFHGWTMTPNPASTSPSAGPTRLISFSLTTSYGIEQGGPYGTRHNITWDNYSVAAYCPYYYYGGGIQVIFISTEDASFQTQWSYQTSNWGFNLFPMNKSEFFVRDVQYNSDGNNGIYGYMFSPRAAYKYGINESGSATSSGGGLSGQGSYLPLDVGYTSTLYPHMGPIGTWVRT